MCRTICALKVLTEQQTTITQNERNKRTIITFFNYFTILFRTLVDEGLSGPRNIEFIILVVFVHYLIMLYFVMIKDK